MQGTVLSDGFLRATWATNRDQKRGPATLTIHALTRLTKRASAAVEAEGRRFMRLMAADDGEHEVRVVAAP